RYEALGLVLFVAIPLPVTGGWTGAVAAFLFGIRRRYAIPAILLGIMLAGLIVSGATQGFLHLLGS
ncbi:small multi-drug export protein, partial [bacterium]|nr:small multi-drug export protein [bacterium]